MADYKSGFKRNGNDRFTSYVLIGFAVAFFVLILTVILFNVFSNELDYDSFTHIENESTIYGMPESEYLVYFYTESCGACKSLKYEVLQFADSNNQDVKVYFVDLDEVRAGGSLFVPTEVQYTPTLIIVVNGVQRDLIVGAGEEDIPAVFDEINNGTNLYIN